MIKTHNLPQYLLKTRHEIEQHAKDMGLSFFDTIFQVVDYEEMSSLAAYGGFPNRYPHWRFGMMYNKQSQSYRYGVGTIFEMVINNDPAYAYLLDCNNMVQQKMVMAHVFGHVDFFTNNYMFQRTNRKMMDKTANNATKVRQYADKHGVETVEKFMDIALSLENLIDITAPFRAQNPKKYEEEQPKRLSVEREYMDAYMNPKREFKKPEEDEEKKRKMLKLVTEPERDILNFLVKHAPMTRWQKHILEIIREESYYYAPQAQTKILNEGWASYCHEQIMTQKCLDSSEIIEFADWHSRITSRDPRGGLNPYALGLALLRDVKERWDKGKHGKDYEMCDDMEKRRNWNTHENKGSQKLLEIRKHYNDITFIDEFFTQEFVTDQKLFKVAKHESKDHYHWIIDSTKVNDVKQELLSQMANIGNPFIFVTDGNYQNKGELLLHHKWESKLLDRKFAYRTLANLEQVWSRPVNIETLVVETGKDAKADWHRIRCENGKFNESKIEDKDISYKY